MERIRTRRLASYPLLILTDRASMLWAGIAAAACGAALGFGIMGYHLLVDGTSYTAVSWALIAPVWLGAALFWVLALRFSPYFFIVMTALATSAGIYYGDVYGQYAGGFLVVVGPLHLIVTDSGRLTRPR